MYYKEEIINGITYFKTTPSGEWKELSNKQLTERLILANQTISDLRAEIKHGD